MVESQKASPRLVIRAPRAGHVIRKEIVEGSHVQEGMTLLIVTHEKRVSHAASRVLVLHDGRLYDEDAAPLESE